MFGLELLNVRLELSLLHLSHFFFLQADGHAFSDLVDEDLSSTFLSLMSSFLSLMLRSDCLQALNFHHHVKSLLLLDPVLLKLLVLIDLDISDRVDLAGMHHLVHVLDIIEVLIHLVVYLREECVLSEDAGFDFDGGVRSPLSVHSLHAILAGERDSHPVQSLIVSFILLFLKRELVLDDGARAEMDKI